MAEEKAVPPSEEESETFVSASLAEEEAVEELAAREDSSAVFAAEKSPATVSFLFSQLPPIVLPWDKTC